MPAPISTYVADQLGISESRAQHLLHAMFGEIKKRAAAGSGVRVPELGTFRYIDGELTFAPSPSLSRAVNQRYEGLDAESLSDFDLVLQTSNEVYSTGETGVWSPFRESPESVEAPPEPTASASASSGVSTALDDLPEPERPTSSAEPTTAPEPDSPSIWDIDLDDDHMGGDASNASTVRPHPADHVSEHLETDSDDVNLEEPKESSIWDNDSAWDFSSVSSDDSDDAEDTATAEDTLDAEDSDPYAPGSFSAADEAAYDEDEAYVADEYEDEEDHEAEPEGRSRLPLVLGLIVLLAALGTGAWFMFGGASSTPSDDAQTTATAGESATGERANDERADASTADETPSDATTDAGDASSQDAVQGDAMQEDPAPSRSAPSRSNVSTRPIIPSEGGWTIVVGSYTDRSEATPTMRSYIQTFAGEGYPVDILTGTSNGTTRYRVAIGQFTSRDQALGVIEQAGGQLPDGAWTMQIE